MSMYTPTLEQARAYGDGYRAVPISRTLLSDLRTPIEVLRVLKNVSRHCYLLESLEDSDRWGRYTFLGFRPSMEITCVDGTVRITEQGKTRTVSTSAPGTSCARSCGITRAPGYRASPPSPAGWWATSPMILSATPSPT